MATPEDICNLALFRVKAGEIGSLDEQSSNAEKCRVLYPQARDAVLSMGAHWSFAKAYRALSAKSETPTEWQYMFDYPDDSLKILYLIPLDAEGSADYYYSVYDIPETPYEMQLDSAGAKVVVTNCERVSACYIKKITDTTLFDPLFVDMLACRLALDLALPLGGDSGKRYRDEARNDFEVLKGQAVALNANQQRPRLRQQIPKSIQAQGGNHHELEYQLRRGRS